MLEEMVKTRHSIDERLRINPGGGTAEWNGPWCHTWNGGRAAQERQ